MCVVVIANASDNLANPRRSLPIAYMGGVAIVIVAYILIATVVRSWFCDIRAWLPVLAIPSP